MKRLLSRMVVIAAVAGLIVLLWVMYRSESRDRRRLEANQRSLLTDVESIISAQWFVKMKTLADEAIRSVEAGETKFVPERFTKNYMNWMTNIRDWCISHCI